ncbi:hypothetical protein LCGC14_3040450, partial [marine sediment metagenome]
PNTARSFRNDGMTLRQYAAIKLRVPRSGSDWLDEFVRESLRDQFAGQIIAGTLANPMTAEQMQAHRNRGATFPKLQADISKIVCDVADAMLAEKQRREPEGGEPL